MLSTVGVVGAGTIGAGVAESFAAAGLKVVLIDVGLAQLENALHRIRNSLRAMRLTNPTDTPENVGDVLGRIHVTTNLSALSSVDYVVENVFEDRALKLEIFGELDRICPAGCILAVNTSAVPVAHVAAATRRPELVIGVHFMNPVAKKRTVEVIRGALTGDDTLRQTLAVLERIGKQAVVVGDGPGFVSNRVLMLTVNESMRVVEDGVSDAHNVDKIFRECFGHPMGPLETADLIGLDTILATLDVLVDLTHDQKFDACPLLRTMVRDGYLGRKSGRGFFKYE
ncbi:3-hydroxyacyl-CoA dehydrogenase family protein [Mesorhizobium sp. M0772]|uniref:3-hydroxyacyl-CoA dehydrogenase family protein n=1 Tax=Mesorhizobium sp. M0772 TaxID=2956998 RepID=UPI003339030D